MIFPDGVDLECEAIEAYECVTGVREQRHLSLYIVLDSFHEDLFYNVACYKMEG